VLGMPMVVVVAAGGQVIIRSGVMPLVRGPTSLKSKTE
jgi:hypothetical protein